MVGKVSHHDDDAAEVRSLIRRMEVYFNDASFLQAIEKFCSSRCSEWKVVELRHSSSHRTIEVPLVNDEIHREYCSLVEGMMEAGLSKDGYKLEDVTVLLRKLLDSREERKSGGISDDVFRTVESFVSFDVFSEMMESVVRGEGLIG